MISNVEFFSLPNIKRNASIPDVSQEQQRLAFSSLQIVINSSSIHPQFSVTITASSHSHSCPCPSPASHKQIDIVDDLIEFNIPISAQAESCQISMNSL
jgi:hypothetical protein